MSYVHSGKYQKPRFELADVFSRYLASYREKHKLSSLQEKVVNAIQWCRTARLGGHKWVCSNSECDFGFAQGRLWGQTLWQHIHLHYPAVAGFLAVASPKTAAGG